MFRFPRSAAAALLALGLLTLEARAQAAPAAWTIDPNHTTVGFSIRHLFSKVNGTFAKVTGSFVYDPQKPESSSVNAEIDASSVTTNNETRDKDLRSENFFDVAKYPTLTFASTAVTSAGEGTLKIDGNLTMHGVTKPVSLDVTFLGSGKGPMGEDRSGFEATGTLDRKDFGIVWNRTLDQGGTLLGDDVAIHLSIEGYIRPAGGDPRTTPRAKK